MIIGVPKEISDGENRVAAIPATVKEYTKKGIDVLVEFGAGEKSFISNAQYEEAGATIVDKDKLYSKSDMIIKVNSPIVNEHVNECDSLKEESSFISFFQTTRELDAVKELQKKKINGFSMHLIPRTTLAQKMDALSSQSNIAGYKAVLLGSAHIAKYMPLLMTAAGTIQPSKILVIGAGVAGLQAIATAKRLGAQVYAFDVRPVVKEQVESLGAKFVEVEAGDNDGVGEGGYAKETSDEYKKKQGELLKEYIAMSDLVITTALIPGKTAPKIITKEMVEAMSPGSVIMDLASENGGNCELTKPGEIFSYNNIIIDGSANIPSTMPIHASQMYAKNISALISYMCPEGKLNLDMEDEIISGSIFTHNGNITHQITSDMMNGE